MEGIKEQWTVWLHLVIITWVIWELGVLLSYGGWWLVGHHIIITEGWIVKLFLGVRFSFLPSNPKIISICWTVLRWALLIFKVKLRMEGIKSVKFNCVSAPPLILTDIMCWQNSFRIVPTWAGPSFSPQLRAQESVKCSCSCSDPPAKTLCTAEHCVGTNYF